jgi:hypothetical protein
VRSVLRISSRSGNIIFLIIIQSSVAVSDQYAFVGLLAPDPLIRGTDSAPDPSVIKQI